jgi:hypothetical protein
MFLSVINNININDKVETIYVNCDLPEGNHSEQSLILSRKYEQK